MRTKQQAAFTTEKLPPQRALIWAIITALRSLGGEAPIRATDHLASQLLGPSERVLQQLHGRGPKTELSYRFGWARYRLRRAGLIAVKIRGSCVLTELGSSISEEDAMNQLRLSKKVTK
jgi:restriction system protein